jgi:hypothetical protein
MEMEHIKLNFSFFPFLNGLAALKDLEPLIYNVITTILQYVGFWEMCKWGFECQWIQ